jgi:hypothetical protein
MIARDGNGIIAAVAPVCQGGWPEGTVGEGPANQRIDARRVTSTAVSEVKRTGLAVDLTLYLAARLAMVAVIAAVLVFAGVPLLVALAIALVASMPLSMLVLRGLNARVTAGLAERGERRKAERARLRAELRGDAADEDR